MLRVGLTGGIGSGKSQVSRRLAERGAFLIDADVAAREVVEPGTPGLGQIVAVFGPDVLLPDGRLDRPKLGQLVFADDDLLAKLNAIVHPLVAERTQQLEQRAATTLGPAGIVVHDVPLLTENQLQRNYDTVIVVDAPDEIRLQRLIEDRGMTPGQARERMAAQAGRDQRLAIADVVVDNSGTLADLDRQVAEIWPVLRDLAARGTGMSDPPRTVET
ncbi:MAG TPA: dephospho-CoA kinase [Streptosporangiaceae bacterium]|nr:dephospho-CoA kinase [Streptosporangiaceae bacterium]